MNSNRQASSCRWAIPTLLVDAPLWLYAWDAPWACVCDDEPRVLGTTHRCATCGRWEPPAEAAPATAHAAARGRPLTRYGL
jgi:hypothetical protein